MNLVMVELMSFSGYLSFKKIPLKLSHSSANISGEDERQWARFNIEVIVCNGRQHDFDSEGEGLYLSFSCKHMFPTVSH